MHLVVQQNSLLCRGGDRVHCGLTQPANLYLQQGRRDDLMAVSTWRTLMWIGLWWEEEVDFGKQCKAELHIGLLRLLPVCCSTREGTGPGDQEEGASGDVPPFPKFCPVEG